MTDPEKSPRATIVPSAYLDLPFAKRWREALDHAVTGGGWHVHSAPSQYGKTTANRAHTRAAMTVKGAGVQTQKPVAECFATDGKRLILRSLGEMLADGGERFLRLPNPELRVPALCKALGVKLIIVNNAHNLEWHQWQELLTLDEVCWSRHGIRPAIVLSGVHKDVGLVALPKSPVLIEQIKARIVCYEEVKGHSSADVGEALKLVLARDCPPLDTDAMGAQSGLLFSLLTTPQFDRWGRKLVSAMDIVEVARRMAAVYAEAPRTRAENIIRQAVADYGTHREPRMKDSSERAAGAANALAALA